MAIEEVKRKKQSSRDVSWEIANAGVALPTALEAFHAQKYEENRDKKGGREAYPSTSPGEKKMNQATTQSAINVPPAGGETQLDEVANILVNSMKPATDTLRKVSIEAAERLEQAVEVTKKAEREKRMLNLGEFSAKGAIVLGFTTAAMFIARSLWRNRDAHLATADSVQTD